MADINFDCPHCGHNLEVSERGAGLTVACPECSKSIVMPIPAPELVVKNIIFNCGACGQSLKASSDMAGQLIDCPVCNQSMEIPFASRPTPATPTHPAAISMPIPKSPSQRQVPGFGTRKPAAPSATRPAKANSPGLVIAVIFLALVCSGLTAGMIFLIKNSNDDSTTVQGTPLAPTKENVLLTRPTTVKEPLAEKVLSDVDGNGGNSTDQETPFVSAKVNAVSVQSTDDKVPAAREKPLAPNETNMIHAQHNAEKGLVNENVLPDIVVDGEVFIVTKGGQNIKLGLVEVGVIPMQTLVPYLEKQYAEQTNALARMEREIKAAYEEQSRLHKAVLLAENQMVAAEQKKQSDWQATEFNNKKLDSARGAARRADITLKLKLKWFLGIESLLGGFYFDKMPNPLRVTKTNADGRFRIQIPGIGVFVIVARASRHVVDEEEQYYWLIKIDPKAGVNQTIMLSNDNLMTCNGMGIFLQTNR